MNRLRCQGLSQRWELANIIMVRHKRKDGGAQWLYCYTIHGRCREMGFGALRVSL
nr:MULTISPECIES: DUF4102 domain-containing protein [unclassified Bartonella]